MNSFGLVNELGSKKISFRFITCAVGANVFDDNVVSNSRKVRLDDSYT